MQFVCGLLYSTSCCCLSDMSFARCYVLIVLCLFSCFALYFVCSVFLYSSVYCSCPCLQLFILYLCTSLPTTATGWIPNCS